MPSQSPDPPNDFVLRQRALARWENEGGKTLPLDLPRAEGGGAEPKSGNDECRNRGASGACDRLGERTDLPSCYRP
jgi:hypothetical protein